MTDVQTIILTCPKCSAALHVSYSRFAPEKSVKCSSCGTDIPLPQDAQPKDATPERPVVVPISVAVPAPRSLAGRIVAGVVGGLILAVLVMNVFEAFFTDLTREELSAPLAVLSVIVFLAIWAGAIVLAVKSPCPARAWRHLLIPSGIVSLSIPLAVIVPFFRMSSQVLSKGGHMAPIEAAAYAMGGMVGAALMGVLGFFLAAILLTIGLLVGREAKK